MILTVASYKGGVGKTTTAIHLAAFFQKLGETLLVDGDAIRASIKWSKRGTGTGLPFKVVDDRHQAKAMQEKVYRYTVFDTEGNPSPEGLQAMADGCDVMVIPAVPQTAASDGLFFTLEELRKLGITKHRVLLNMVKHNRRGEADELRSALEALHVPLFKAEIPELVAFDKANASGVPVYAVDDERAERAWAAFQAVGKEITRA
jgi:chromosome partitioning protein